MSDIDCAKNQNIKKSEIQQPIMAAEEKLQHNLFQKLSQVFIKSWQELIDSQKRIAEWNPNGFRNPKF